MLSSSLTGGKGCTYCVGLKVPGLGWELGFAPGIWKPGQFNQLDLKWEVQKSTTKMVKVQVMFIYNKVFQGI